MKYNIGLVLIKKDSGLFTNIKKLLEEEYMYSFMSLDEFCEKYSINFKAVQYVLKSSGMKKDMSKFNAFKKEEVIKNIAATKLEKYGSATYNNSEKNKKTCLERYGVEHPRQNKEINEKGNSTFNKNYPKGSNQYRELIENRTKIRNETLQNLDYGELVRTTRQKHALKDPDYLKDIQSKRINTTLINWGVDNVSQSELIKDNKKQTCLERYGVENYNQTEESREKIKQTCLKKYGVDSYSKTKEYASKRCGKWVIDGKKFDSKWEIYYYYYLEDNNIPFEEQVPLKYKDQFNNDCVYFCDFKRLDTNELIEIKNPALLDSEGNLKLLWQNNIEESKKDFLEEKLKHKNNCLKQNKIIILSDEVYFKELEKQFKKNHKDLKILKGNDINENN